uniref:Uncharacterized protein n=1 Tax=Hucho hucho TaxID=62062 RepID=A0A4W5MB37_9TELE
MENREEEDTTSDVPGHKCPLLCDSLHGSMHDRDNSPMMRAVFRSPVCKVYRFQTESSRWMLVREQMSESPLSSSLPKQLLSCYIQEDMRRVQELGDLCDLSPYWDGLRSDVIAHYSQLISTYQETLTELNKLTVHWLELKLLGDWSRCGKMVWYSFKKTVDFKLGILCNLGKEDILL